MRKNILILVSLIVLFSLFNTIGANFKLWNSPSINTNHIITPDIPVSFDTDISLFGLFVNFFSDLELDYEINNTVISNESVSEGDDEEGEDEATEQEQLKNLLLDFCARHNLTERECDLLLGTATNSRDMDSLDALIAANGGMSAGEEDVTTEEEVIEEEVIEEEVIAVIEEEVIEEEVIEEEVIEEEVIEEVVIEEVVIGEVVIGEEVIGEEVIAEEVIEEAVIAEEVIEEAVIAEEVIEEAVIAEEVYIKSDEEIIRDNSQIKDNAKELILESLKNEIITMADVADLLSEYAGKDVKKKHVKKLIKRKKK